MRKVFILLIFIQIIICASSGQSKNIDSLKRVLPYLHNSAWVDCINEIVFYYFSINKKDSVQLYSTLAYEEAKKLNYVHGIAVSLSQKAAIQMNNGGTSEAGALAVESLQWYKLTNNKKDIEIPYYQMGREYFAQNKWDSAVINLKQSFYWAKKENSSDRMLSALSLTGEVYRENGNYDLAFDMFKQELQMAIQYKDTIRIEGALCNIGDLYQAIEDYPTALAYYTKGFEIIKPKDLTIWDYTSHAELFTLNHQYDSALHYYNFIDSAKIDIRFLPVFLVSKGEYFLLRKEYDTALKYFLKGLFYHRQFNSINQIKRTLLDIAKTYFAKNNDTAALQYVREALNKSLQTKSRQYVRDAYQILYSIYDRLHKTDSAYFYYRKYIEMKEVVLSNQIKGKFAGFSYEQKIALLNQQQELQQQQLKQSAQQEIFLIIGITGILLLGIIILRNTVLKRKNEKNLREMAENELQLEKLKSEKKQSELQSRASELEMQALRSQMNPHFIFNSLNSVNRFILQNERVHASEYLTKFSKLVRLILQNSQSALITLESELESLRLYLDLEALRFNYHFDYKISVPKDLDISALQVPPLILQPYTENAIWHGLMHKEERGQLDIEVFEENNYLYFKITDDGIGRKQAAAFASKSSTKHKSMGLRITENRIAIIQSSETIQSPVTINDLMKDDGSAAGTEVIIKIPVLYD